jgi:hypothetical protein
VTTVVVVVAVVVVAELVVGIEVVVALVVALVAGLVGLFVPIAEEYFGAIKRLANTLIRTVVMSFIVNVL